MLAPSGGEAIPGVDTTAGGSSNLGTTNDGMSPFSRLPLTVWLVIACGTLGLLLVLSMLWCIRSAHQRKMLFLVCTHPNPSMGPLYMPDERREEYSLQLGLSRPPPQLWRVLSLLCCVTWDDPARRKPQTGETTHEAAEQQSTLKQPSQIVDAAALAVTVAAAAAAGCSANSTAAGSASGDDTSPARSGRRSRLLAHSNPSIRWFYEPPDEPRAMHTPPRPLHQMPLHQMPQPFPPHVDALSWAEMQQHFNSSTYFRQQQHAFQQEAMHQQPPTAPPLPAGEQYGAIAAVSSMDASMNATNEASCSYGDLADALGDADATSAWYNGGAPSGAPSNAEVVAELFAMPRGPPPSVRRRGSRDSLDESPAPMLSDPALLTSGHGDEDAPLATADESSSSEPWLSTAASPTELPIAAPPPVATFGLWPPHPPMLGPAQELETLVELPTPPSSCGRSSGRSYQGFVSGSAPVDGFADRPAERPPPPPSAKERVARHGRPHSNDRLTREEREALAGLAMHLNRAASGFVQQELEKVAASTRDEGRFVRVNSQGSLHSMGENDHVPSASTCPPAHLPQAEPALPCVRTRRPSAQDWPPCSHTRHATHSPCFDASLGADGAQSPRSESALSEGNRSCFSDGSASYAGRSVTATESSLGGLNLRGTLGGRSVSPHSQSARSVRSEGERSSGTGTTATTCREVIASLKALAQTLPPGIGGHAPADPSVMAANLRAIGVRTGGAGGAAVTCSSSPGAVGSASGASMGACGGVPSAHSAGLVPSSVGGGGEGGGAGSGPHLLPIDVSMANSCTCAFAALQSPVSEVPSGSEGDLMRISREAARDRAAQMEAQAAAATAAATGSARPGCSEVRSRPPRGAAAQAAAAQSLELDAAQIISSFPQQALASSALANFARSRFGFFGGQAGQEEADQADAEEGEAQGQQTDLQI